MIQNLDLTSGIDWNPTATIAASQRAKQESDQRLTEGQLNIKKLQLAIDQATKEQTENDQVKAIVAQGGDPQQVYQKLLQVNPDKARAYLTNSQADTLQAQQQALLRAKTLEGQVAPTVTTAAPQTTTAPIQTSLTNPAEVSQPQVSAPAKQEVSLPLPSVEVPFIGQPSTRIQPQSQQQLTLADRARAEFNARLEAQKKAAEGVIIPEGAIFHREGQPDIVGQAKQSDIEKEAAPWLARPENRGKSLPDYVKQKGIDTAASSEYGQKLAAFNSNPALVKQFGAGPNGLSAKEHADQVQVREQEARAAVVQQQALQQGAVKSVAPHLIIPATEAYAKDSKAYVDAAQAADDMKTFVTESQAGNKLAYSYTPAEGALYLSTSRGVKRINANEINAYGGGGSAWDRVQAFLGKQLSGASIPPALLKDMAEVNQAVGVNAKTAYQRKVDVTNKAFGSTFEPIDFGSGSTAAPLSFTYQGKTLTFPDQKSYDAAKAAAGIK